MSYAVFWGWCGRPAAGSFSIDYRTCRSCDSWVHSGRTLTWKSVHTLFPSIIGILRLVDPSICGTLLYCILCHFHFVQAGSFLGSMRSSSPKKYLGKRGYLDKYATKTGQALQSIPYHETSRRPLQLFWPDPGCYLNQRRVPHFHLVQGLTSP